MSSEFAVLIPFARKEELSRKYVLSWDGSSGFWLCGNERIYNFEVMKPFHIKQLEVHYTNKDLAKSYGCKWSPSLKKWCIAVGEYTSNPVKYDDLSQKKITRIIPDYDSVVDEDAVTTTIV